jgi:hypothetical protein
MTANQPEFDPLTCTRVESDQMLQGYDDGICDRPPPKVTSQAYDHGRRMAVNDKAGVVDDDQRELARRMLRDPAVMARLFDEIG